MSLIAFCNLVHVGKNFTQETPFRFFKKVGKQICCLIVTMMFFASFQTTTICKNFSKELFSLSSARSLHPFSVTELVCGKTRSKNLCMSSLSFIYLHVASNTHLLKTEFIKSKSFFFLLQFHVQFLHWFKNFSSFRQT